MNLLKDGNCILSNAIQSLFAQINIKFDKHCAVKARTISIFDPDILDNVPENEL